MAKFISQSWTKTSSVGVVSIALVVAASTSCTPQRDSSHVQVVRSASVKTLEMRKSISPDTALAPAIKVTITVNQDALLSQEFLYGADLQYSSYYDPAFSLYNQSLAVGHIPARFRIVGDEIELVADNRRLFPSDVNHPEQLLSRFQIISQTPAGPSSPAILTLSTAKSGVLLTQIFEGSRQDTHGGLLVPNAQPPRDSWVRSFEYIPAGNYLLQETSVVLADGSIAEFMESVFPRTTLNPGSSFQKFQMDPSNPIGGDQGVLARYRFLPGEKVYEGEDAVAYASHYDISPGQAGNAEGTIDWYVTRDIPDEDLAPVGLAVEGWNRYFSRFDGIKRPVVKFKGKLPEGIKLGDPRYNVVAWDNRHEAGAAYETQAEDPSTGKQSHSLIYMPAAWLKIGTDYWLNGQYSDSTQDLPALESSGLVRRACARDLREAAGILASGRTSKDRVESFGIELLKQTLFHEVGHALGLAHNFKGSLSYDLAKPLSERMFSSSIMDYNNFEIERAAFDSVDSSEGPQLEYDRQAISALYNSQKDVKNSDPVLAACNDSEADQEKGGVDPFCMRYDAENDPTLSVTTAFDRMEQATLKDDVTLSDAVRNVPGLVLDNKAVQSVKTADDLKSAAKRLSNGLKGAATYFLVTSRSGVLRTVKANLKALFVFGDSVNVAPHEARAMRERSYQGIKKALDLTALPAPVLGAEKDAVASAAKALAESPYIKSLGSAAGDQALATALVSAAKTLEAFTADTKTGSPKIRISVLSALKRHPDVPFYFGTVDESKVDYETAVITELADRVKAAPGRTFDERTAAATALASYKGRFQGETAIAALTPLLEAERLAATDNAGRELANSLLEIL